MHFDNDIHGEALGLGHDRAGLFVGQHRHHRQHRVGAGGARLRVLLAGAGTKAEQDITALNAGALLMTAGKASSLREGFRQARDALLSGEAGRVLNIYVEASHG